MKKSFTISRKEEKSLLKEHKRLVPELRKAGLKKEARIQAKDLKEIKRNLKRK